MANYDANIRVLLDAQSALKAIENLGQRLDRVKNKATKIQVKAVINEEKAAVQAAEKRLTNQIRLNAALERQTNLLKSLTRAGVEGERGNRVKELVEAGKQFKNNLNIQYAINTALEKELQTQREINRTNSAQNANSSKVLTTFSKRLDLLRAVGATEAEISKVTKTRDKAIERNSRKQTDLAKESFAQLDRQLSTLERKYSAFLNPQKQAASPIGGSKTLVGSPEYLKNVRATVDALERQRVKESAITEELAERTRELNKQVRLRNSIREKIENVRSARAVRERSTFLQGDPQAYERPAGPGGAFRFPQADAIEAAARKQKNFNALQEEARKKAQGNLELQYNWAKALGQRAEIAKELRDVAAADLNTQKQAAKAEERRLRLARRRKDVLKAREKAQRTQRAVGEGIIGGAFPLLFGQGIGASVGGGLGGAAGGLMGGQFGLGLSLVGTAVGSAVDTFVKNMGDLANSLGDPAKALEALEQAGLKVDASVKTQVESLLKAGKAYEAQQIIFKQINSTLGPAAVDQLNAYQQESEKLNSAYQEISGSIQREMLPALVGLLSMINTIVKAANDLNLGSAAKKGLLANLAILNPPLLISGLALQQTGTQAGKQAGENVPLSPELQRIEVERVLKNKELEDSLRLQVELSNRKLDAAKLNKKTDLDAWLVAQQQIVAQEYKIKNEEIYLRYKREGLTTEIRSLLVQENRNERSAKLVKILQDYKNIQDDLNRSQAQADKRALADAKAIAQARASARASELNATKTLFASSVALTKQKEGEIPAAEQRLKQLDLEMNGQLEILATRYKQQAADAKTKEESASLYYAYRQQYDTILNTYELEKLRTQELLNQLKVFGNIQRISAAAGFQVPTDRPEAFVPKGAEGILSPGAGLTDFMTGAELAPIIEQEAALARVLEKYQQIGEAAGIASQLATFGLRDMIEGTKSAEQVFADFLRNIAEMLLQTAATMIAQYVAIGIARMFAMGQSATSIAKDIGTTPLLDFNANPGSALGGLGGFRANGGPVTPNTTYLVGERGPELLTMGSQGGYVHSNQSSAMDRYRNGGPAGTQTVNVNYSVTEINGMRFVTEDQFRAGLDQAAKRGAKMGQTQTMSTLKNSRSQRSKIGL